MEIDTGEMERKIGQEVARFTSVEKVHLLPKSYEYWRKSYLRPKFDELGFAGLKDFYVKTIGGVASDSQGRIAILSVGSGNCDAELDLAKSLVDAGIRDFEFRCVDLNEAMLARGTSLVEKAGLAKQFRFDVCDFNSMSLEAASVDVVFANHSLHHVQALEHLFQELHLALKVRGVFLMNDMIGRNGHMKWPEALTYIDSLWEMLAEEKRFHHQLQATHHRFPNLDCSKVGFEGIRAQDILPLMLEFFSPAVFLGFTNIVQPFIGRGYGPNFDPDTSADRLFLDHAARLDDLLLDQRVVKPTQAIASFSKLRSGRQRYYRRRSAESSIRWP